MSNKHPKLGEVLNTRMDVAPTSASFPKRSDQSDQRVRRQVVNAQVSARAESASHALFRW